MNYIPAENTIVLREEEFTDAHFDETPIGKLVREAFAYMFSHKLLDDEEIKRLMRVDYSREYLGCAYSAIVDKKEDTVDGLGNKRYYSAPYEYKGQKLYLCSEWYSGDKKRFIPWFKSILNRKELI